MAGCCQANSSRTGENFRSEAQAQAGRAPASRDVLNFKHSFPLLPREVGLGGFSLTEARQWADDCLKPIVTLKGLRELSLRMTQVTDEGVEQIASLNALERLDLGGTRVTDAGLKHVATLKSLKELALDGCTIAAAASGNAEM